MTRALHIVQGGIENGDKSELERIGRRGGKRNVSSWIAPRAARPGDDVIIYVGGYGLFATAKISGVAHKRRDWRNRYGAPLSNIRLIQPPISLGVLTREVPALKWTEYPRSITTPEPRVAERLRALIERRRKSRGIDAIARTPIREMNLEELYRVALPASGASKATRRMVTSRLRREVIKRYVLRRAGGICESCSDPAPFKDVNGEPFLEAHHITRLADEGLDHPRNGIGVCPNCHRKAHHAADRSDVLRRMKKQVALIERRAGH